MALIDHHQSIVLLGEVAYLVHRSDIAVHREHAVGDDDAEALSLCLLQALLQFLHVGVGVTIALCLAEAHTVDDARVVEGVADDGVFLREEGFEDTAVGVEAGSIEDGIFRVEVVADGSLELLVDVLCAADEADARHAEAALLHHLRSAFDETRMVGEAEVVVGTEVQHLFALHLNGSLLWTFDEALFLVKASFTNLSERLAEMFFHFTVHILGFKG